jgi:GNAT superfamily N-acetyltransferase
MANLAASYSGMNFKTGKIGCARPGPRATMAGMGWRTTGDVAEFLAATGEYLERERARNTVILTVSEQLRLNPARYSPPAGGDAGTVLARGPLLGWWTDRAGAAAGAFLHTPPHPLLLTAVPAAVAADLAVALAGRPLGGVNGYAEAAEAFAATWRAATVGRRATQERRLRLYRLGELAWPDPAPDGAPRVAADADAPLLTDWFVAFAEEVHDSDAREDQAVAVREKLSHGGVLVWEAGGRPVSVAGVTRQVAGMIRVGPVYTPPELRGHGYASAVTAAVSRRAREAGAAEVLLYTDLANATSNSVYQRIGYRAVEDRVVLAFSEP